MLERIPLRAPYPGDPVDAAEQRRLIEVVNKLQGIQGDGTNTIVTHTRHGPVVGPPTPPVQPPTLGLFLLQEVHDDYLTCVTWNGQSQGFTIYVAKPWLLQKTPFDGKTINTGGHNLLYAFTGSGATAVLTTTNKADSTTEAHTMCRPWHLPDTSATPPYLGEVIVALRDFGAISGIGHTGGQMIAADGTPVEWLDLNWANRDWRVSS